jgi:hypothetical protein
MAKRFNITCNGERIGTSDLESRDAGMGIATGRFTPAAAYERVRPVFRLFAEAQCEDGPADVRMLADYYRSRDSLVLSVETEDGVVVPTTTVHIADFMEELDQTACEVEAHVADPSFFEEGSPPSDP